MSHVRARSLAQRIANMAGEPAVFYGCSASGWGMWHNLDAADWLSKDAEIILPERMPDPAGVERRLRERAAKVHGLARVKLLEAAMLVRGHVARQSQAGCLPSHLAPIPSSSMLKWSGHPQPSSTSTLSADPA